MVGVVDTCTLPFSSSQDKNGIIDLTMKIGSTANQRGESTLQRMNQMSGLSGNDRTLAKARKEIEVMATRLNLNAAIPKQAYVALLSTCSSVSTLFETRTGIAKNAASNFWSQVPQHIFIKNKIVLRFRVWWPNCIC